VSKSKSKIKASLVAGPGATSHVGGDSGIEIPLTEEELAAAEREARTEAKKARIRERRATFDLDPAIRRLLRVWSGRYGVPQSQMVMLAVVELKGLIESGEISIEAMRSESDSPKFAYNLELNEAIAAAAAESEMR